MNKILMFLVAVLLLGGCASEPSASAVETAIAQTATASGPTSTPEPPTPTPKPPVDCEEDEAAEYIQELIYAFEDFDDTAEIANSTPRSSLAPVLQNLQSIRRDAQRLDSPECAEYLQDIASVAMQAEIDAFVSFLSQDSDSVVSSKMSSAASIRETVNQEVEAFRDDPLTAYETSDLSPEALVEDSTAQEPFELPDSWSDIELSESGDLIISLPEGWSGEAASGFLSFENDDGLISGVFSVLDDSTFAGVETDYARLFSIQTQLETQGWDFYSEWSSDVEIAALNKAYTVQFSHRRTSSGDIEDQIWTVVVLPDGQEVFGIVNSDRDDFAQIDLLLLTEIYGSIREK